LPVTEQFWLDSGIKVHPHGLNEIYYQRQVNNIYFDDLNHNAFKDNLIGASDRYKLRLRWYGASATPTAKSNLEVKLKTGDLYYKWFAPFTKAARLPKPIYEMYKRSRPVLYNRYQRQYYLSFDGKVRLTVDRQLVFCPLASGLLPPTDLRQSDKVVVELKYLPDDEPSAVRIIQALPLQLSKNSKFVDGMSYQF
jgi:hypothetical protein